jgi:hypothetical protein
LRTQLEASFEARKQEWIDQLEHEFRTRESAVQRQVMAEIDARVRNEKISQETALDLLKEETSMELEVEMEARLKEFRDRKEGEVTDQLDRQLAKREEIMRNKALIEVRRRESEIRAEIEAQLAVKRAEIRERLATLEIRAEEFRQTAEAKIRTQLEVGLVSDEDIEEQERLKQVEEEVDELEQGDSVLSRRERWMGALGGARAQMPRTAAGAEGPTKLGQPAAARLGQAPEPGAPAIPALSGGSLAPVRAPIGQRPAPTASDGPARMGALAPVRAPIEPQTPAAQPLKTALPAESAPVPESPESVAEPDVEIEPAPEPVAEPAESTTTTLRALAGDFEESQQVAPKPERTGFGIAREVDPRSDVELTARGPPGGGRLVRDGPRPVVGGPPVAGPPVDEPEPELKPSAIIQPVRRPILKPRVDDDEEDEFTEAVLRPTTRRVLQPTPAKATLTPKRVLEPVEEEGTDEDSD